MLDLVIKVARPRKIGQSRGVPGLNSRFSTDVLRRGDVLRRNFGLFVFIVVLSVSVPASAGILVDFPDTSVPDTATTVSIPITVTFEQDATPYDMGGFNLKLDITGDAGCVFTGPAPGTPYVLGIGDNWDPGSIANGGLTLEEVTDARDNDGYLVDASAGDVVLGLIVADFAFSGISIGDQFDIAFDATSANDTALFEYSGSFHAPVWNGGTITVIPEPASMVFLALGGLAILRRRSRLGGDA